MCKLTNKELKVLELAAQGFKNKTIAQKLCIATSTVNIHLINIYNKLGIGTDKNQRVAAARWFLQEV